jgi:hypothetical protein
MTAPMDVKALLALGKKAAAGPWRKAAGWIRCPHGTKIVDVGPYSTLEEDAAFIVAACNFIRSPEFAALVADGERYRYVREHPSVVVEEWDVAWEEPTAIDRKVDAARSGKGEGK